MVWWFGGLVVWWFESVIGFGCYGFTAYLASDEPTANGAISALNPKTWTSALLLFYLSPVFCRTHSACFQANALC
ncbi:hypothetical protein, partial [Yersinia pseudotuberculosis]